MSSLVADKFDRVTGLLFAKCYLVYIVEVAGL